MGSKRFALQGIEYALAAQPIIEYEAVAVAKPAANQRPETQRPKAQRRVVERRGRAGFAPK
jgi:hypothetical protein